MQLFLTAPWVGLQCVIVVFSRHTHLLFCMDGYPAWNEQHTQVCGYDEVVCDAEQYAQPYQWYTCFYWITLYICILGDKGKCHPVDIVERPA